MFSNGSVTVVNGYLLNRSIGLLFAIAHIYELPSLESWIWQVSIYNSATKRQKSSKIVTIFFVPKCYIVQLNISGDLLGNEMKWAEL